MLAATGYDVSFVPKEHLYFVDLIGRLTCYQQEPVDERLLAQGQCIPLAVGCLLGNVESIGDLFAGVPPAMRAYRDVAAAVGISLVPVLDVSLSAGSWLVHSEAGGLLHCIGVSVNRSATDCAIYTGGKTYALRMAEFNAIVAASVDHGFVGY